MKLDPCLSVVLLTVFLGLPAEATSDEEPTAVGEGLLPSVIRQCADAAEGTAIEVCLRLAAAHPDEVDGIAAALRAHIDSRSLPDQELLLATLLALSPETSKRGISWLAAQGDERAVPTLIRLVESSEVDVALAAMEVLAGFESSLPYLSSWISDKMLPLPVRIAAVEALGALEREEGAEAMLAALRRRGTVPKLRQAMVRTIAQHFPERADEAKRQANADGTLWLSAGTSLALGYALSSAARVANTDNLVPFAAMTGAVAGGTLGWVSGSAWPINVEDAAFFTTSGALGTTGGVFLGRALSPQDRGSGGWIGGLAGEVAGYSLGLGLRRLHRGHVPDSLEASGVALASGIALGTGAGFVLGADSYDDEVHIPQLLTGLGVLAGGLVGHAIAPHLRPTETDGWMIALSSTSGLIAGTFIPTTRLRRRALPFTGLAVGYLVGYGLSDTVDASRRDLIGGALGLGIGGSLGYGVGTLIAGESDLSRPEVGTTTLAGSALGLTTGLLISRRRNNPLDPRDVATVSLVTGWSTWQVAGWSAATDVPVVTRVALFTIPMGLGIVSGVLSPQIDLPLSYTFSAGSLGLWAGYVGGTGASLFGRPALPGALISSNVGLALGLLAAARPVSVTPLVVGLADAGGVLGGAAGALGAAALSNDPKDVLRYSLLGAGVGFFGGGVIGYALYREGKPRDVAWLRPRIGHGARWALAPQAWPHEAGVMWGARLDVHGW